MAVAAVGSGRSGRAEQAEQAHFARLAALILDSIFVGIIGWLATAVYGVTQVMTASGSGAGLAYWTTQTAIPGIWTAAIWLVYNTACEVMFSATAGKALNGLKVVSVDGVPLHVRSVVIRNAMRVVDVLPGMYLLGGIAVLSTAHSQRIGDLVAGTTVVFRQDAVEPGTARSAGRRARFAFLAILLALLTFTAGFEYFERPVLAVQGEVNQHSVVHDAVVSYSLGEPTRTLGSVTYPMTLRTATQICTGSISFTWEGVLGWSPAGSRFSCVPG